jgi:hypothetical protein
MLTFYQHLTKDRKDWRIVESFDDFSSETTVEKEQEEGRKLIQNKRVSSQYKRVRKEEGATVDVLSSAILFSLPFLSGWRDCRSSAVRQFLQRKSKPLRNTHKIPFISDYCVVASAIFRWTNETKMQMSLRKQTKNMNK